KPPVGYGRQGCRGPLQPASERPSRRLASDEIGCAFPRRLRDRSTRCGRLPGPSDRENTRRFAVTAPHTDAPTAPRLRHFQIGSSTPVGGDAVRKTAPPQIPTRKEGHDDGEEDRKEGREEDREEGRKEGREEEVTTPSRYGSGSASVTAGALPRDSVPSYRSSTPSQIRTRSIMSPCASRSSTSNPPTTRPKFV